MSRHAIAFILAMLSSTAAHAQSAEETVLFIVKGLSDGKTLMNGLSLKRVSERVWKTVPEDKRTPQGKPLGYSYEVVATDPCLYTLIFKHYESGSTQTTSIDFSKTQDYILKGPGYTISSMQKDVPELAGFKQMSIPGTRVVDVQVDRDGKKQAVKYPNGYSGLIDAPASRLMKAAAYFRAKYCAGSAY